uniref:Hexosyltransferase n=1 Tax=Setaria digitata TaxID=48799 RepID=A0A915Q7A0_9BILA
MLNKIRKLKNLKSYGASPCLFIVFLWALGWTDYIFEKSFSKFKWPPYIDVREQVMLELNGQSASYLYENDWAYFEPFLTPACQKRETIRATWGSVLNHSEFTIKTVFVIGREPFGQTSKQLQEEISLHKDILVGDYIDSYRNNTLKFLSAVQFSFNYCRRQQYTVPYAFLVDDDYLVLVRNLITEVKKYNSHDRLYMGWRFDTRPIRTRFHKHRVRNKRKQKKRSAYSLEALACESTHSTLFLDVYASHSQQVLRCWLYNLAGNLSTTSAVTCVDVRTILGIKVSIGSYPFNRYPSYISAGAVLLSSQTIREMYYAIQYTRLYSYDDVYAGILAKLLNLSVRHNKNMRFWKSNIDIEEGRTLICAHGFEGEHLKSVYSKFRANGFP